MGKSNHQLKHERELRGWSQEKVAEEVGTTARSVSRWERGLSIPYPYFREKLCILFKKNASDLGFTQESEEVEEASAPIVEGKATASPILPYDPLMPQRWGMPHGLVGRTSLLAELKQQLGAGQRLALTAINGLPGVGKTALAIALISDPEVQSQFADGILWAGLGPSPNVSGHLARWAALLGVSAIEINTHRENWTLILRKAIGIRRMLLVIDDAWEMEAALALQVGGPHCAHLVTTRLPQVAAAFASEGILTVPELGEQDGLELLRRFVPDLIVSDEQGARQLVQAVGGLPLALTLMGKYVAAQAYSGQPRRMQKALHQLTRTEQRLSLSTPAASVGYPTPGAAGTPLSLSSVIEMSVQRLSQEAQAAFYALSIFAVKPSSFSEEAALAVSLAPVEALDELCDAGLVESFMTERYSLHQAIADYARIHLKDEQVYGRLIDYYEGHLNRNKSNRRVFEQESSNLLAALAGAVAGGDVNKALGLLQSVITYTRDLGVHELPKAHLLQLHQTAAIHSDPYGIIFTSISIGLLAEQRGLYQEAQAYLEQGVPYARKMGDFELSSVLFAILSLVARDQGDYQQAGQYCEEGLALARSQGECVGVCLLLALYSVALQEQGAYAQVEELCQQSLELSQQTSYNNYYFTTLLALGRNAYLQGHDELALQFFQEELRVARPFNPTEVMAPLLPHLSLTMLALGDLHQAEQYAREGWTLIKEAENREYMCFELILFAQLAQRRGEMQQAERSYQEALRLMSELGHPWVRCELLTAYGQFQLQLQHLEAAQASFQEIVDNVPTAIRSGHAMAQYGLAQVAAAQGDIGKARQLATASLMTMEMLGYRSKESVREWLDALPPLEEPQIGPATENDAYKN